jgi:hypothetical protein
MKNNWMNENLDEKTEDQLRLKALMKIVLQKYQV